MAFFPYWNLKQAMVKKRKMRMKRIDEIQNEHVLNNSDTGKEDR